MLHLAKDNEQKPVSDFKWLELCDPGFTSDSKSEYDFKNYPEKDHKTLILK